MEDALTPDLLAVHELLSTMKFTLSALGKTFESLGEQTTKVAELGPAMEATHQVSLHLFVDDEGVLMQCPFADHPYP